MPGTVARRARGGMVILLFAMAVTPALLGQSNRLTTTDSTDPGGKVRVACVGDSITYGVNVEDQPRNNYPTVLEGLLGKSFQTGNFGVSGATLLRKGDRPYWRLPQFNAVTRFTPKIVVIALGTNDSKPKNWKYGDELGADLASMIKYFRDLPGQPQVWVCLPPPVFATDDDGINEATLAGQVIPRLQQVAKETGAPVIDLHQALTHRAECFPDGVHPNAAGARVIAQAVFAALKKTNVPR
jgi:acyl-CoA thioesterase I